MMKKRVRMQVIETGGLLMAEVNDITEELHKEIDAVPEADRALLLRLVKSYREGTTEAYEQWFKRKVAAGIKAADEGRVISHEALKEKWQAKRAAQLD